MSLRSLGMLHRWLERMPQAVRDGAGAGASIALFWPSAQEGARVAADTPWGGFFTRLRSSPTARTLRLAFQVRPRSWHTPRLRACSGAAVDVSRSASLGAPYLIVSSDVPLMDRPIRAGHHRAAADERQPCADGGGLAASGRRVRDASSVRKQRQQAPCKRRGRSGRCRRRGVSRSCC